MRDSPLSEFGVLGFEYGYSLADPRTLVLWEAQFGDFANGAQMIIDQFIAAGEAKWLRASGLVLLLPHGYRRAGAGAQLGAAGALSCSSAPRTICRSPTAPRRPIISTSCAARCMRDFRKPLVMMTPKSLLRHKLAVSTLADFTGESHFRRILSRPQPAGGRATSSALVLCSGKVAYELMEARDTAGDTNTAIVRIEQLYPFPGEPLVTRLKRDAQARGRWSGRRKSRKNNGAWLFVETADRAMPGRGRVQAEARPTMPAATAAASPATGLAKRHAAEQAALIADALGHAATPRTPQPQSQLKGYATWRPT